jgi:hypothetical protein
MSYNPPVSSAVWSWLAAASGMIGRWGRGSIGKGSGHVQYLFGTTREGKSLADYCEGRKAEMEKAGRHWNPDDLLVTPDQEITDYLIDTYSISCPVLRHDEGRSTEPEPVDLPAYSPIPGMAFGHRGQLLYSVPASERTFIIPYDGDEEVFYRRPNPFTVSHQPEVEIRPGEVHITWQRADRDTPDPGQINAYVTEQVSRLQFYLDQSARHVEMFNRELASRATQLVAARKERLRLERDVSAKLLYPLKRRPDAARYQVPVTRRPLSPRPRPSATLDGPEYELADAAFEDVLKVLRHSRNALERSPSLTAKLLEEEIRFILLVSLNAVFEGLAGGEVFNHKGRTDILIRVEDTNVFVGECKIWTGSSDFNKAINQLLRDLTWRDTKGTLLLFIRNLDVTAVIDKAVEVIQQHPNHIETRPTNNPGDRHDLVLHANGDPNKKLHLAFLPFALGPATTKGS